MYAIIKTGGKQFKVQEGDIIYIEKLCKEVDETFELNEVLAVSNDNGELRLGEPTLEGASVTLKVLGQVKGNKVIVFKYKRKKDYRRKQGHRQPFTKVVIEKINA